MATKRQKKCVCCGELIGVDEAPIPYKNRYAHERCFNLVMKTLKNDKDKKLDEIEGKSKRKLIKTRPRAELKDSVSEEDYQKKKDYYSYLREIIGEDELNPKVYILTEDYIKKYNFTFESMHLTLTYLNEILCKELTGDVVGLIPYYHSEATRYYESCERIKETNNQVDINSMYQRKRVVIKPKMQNKDQIDISSI